MSTYEELLYINTAEMYWSNPTYRNMGIIEIMDTYKTSSCFFMWRMIAHNFPKNVAMADYDMTLYTYIDSSIRCKTESNEIYVVLPYYQFNFVANQNDKYKTVLNDAIKCVDGTNLILAFQVPDKYLNDYKLILESRYSEVSKEFQTTGTDSSVANQVIQKSAGLKLQWERAAKILKCPLEIMLAPDQLYPPFLQERETYWSESSIEKLDQLLSLNI